MIANILLDLGSHNIFDRYPANTATAADNGHAPDGVPAALLHDRATTKYGYKISVLYDHDILPCQMMQMGANGAFYYLKANYTFGF